MQQARKLISERDFNRALFEAYAVGRWHKANGTSWPVDFDALTREVGRLAAADEIAYELDITSATERAFRSNRSSRLVEVAEAS